MSTAYFRILDETVDAPTSPPAVGPVATLRAEGSDATVGPWDPRHMHAGPPSALLARCLERLTGGPDPGLLARVAVEVLAPVPVGRVTVVSTLLRAGPRVALGEATLTAGDDHRPVMRARGWRLRTTDVPLAVPPTPAPSAPAFDAPEVELPPGWGGGYLDSVQWRWADGAFANPGPATVWTRLRGEVVDGEPPSGVQRVLAVADSASGISAVADPRELLFVNTDLTVHLTRAPRGPDVWMRARTVLDKHGIGLTTSELGDPGGSLGVGAQTLFVAPR